MQALSSAQLQSVHTLTSAQLGGSSSTDCTEPVLLESTPVQLSEISTATVGAEKLLKVVEGGDMQEVPDHQQGAEVGGGLEEGGGQGEGGEVRVGDQVKGGDSCSGITAVSIKNQEQGVSFKTSKSAGSVSQRGQLFSSSKGGLCRIGFETTPSKKRRFQQSSTEFQNFTKASLEYSLRLEPVSLADTDTIQATPTFHTEILQRVFPSSQSTRGLLSHYLLPVIERNFGILYFEVEMSSFQFLNSFAYNLR